MHRYRHPFTRQKHRSVERDRAIQTLRAAPTQSLHTKRHTGSFCIVTGALVLALLTIAVIGWLTMEQVYSNENLASENQQAIPGNFAGDDTASHEGRHGSPIDWSHWQQVNPAIIAWIVIPGTPVNYPVVDAPTEDPSFYLTHDVRGRFNWFGCIYRDPDCTHGKVYNTVLYGHNMGWSDKMFGSLASYSDPTFARKHRHIIVYTPHGTKTYRVYAAKVVNGQTARKHVVFTDREDFDQWWQRAYQAADMRLSKAAPAASRLLTLCTCSYHFWDNERTLVYAVPANSR